MGTADADRKPREDEIDTFGLSHPGKVRKTNQDHYLIATVYKRLQVVDSNLPASVERAPEEQRLAALMMVADGVGGGPGGAEASAVALEQVMQYVDESLAVYYAHRRDEREFAELLQAAALRAHEAVQQRRAETDTAGTMATTLTMYIGVWPTYYLLQVGDSRYYVYNKGRLRQLTRDQTMAQDLVEQGAITAEMAVRSPLAHILSSAIGADTSVPVVTRLDFDWDNVHLLCSDGLTKHVSDERISQVLGSMTSAKQACEQLLQDALDGGGSDNVSIIIRRTVKRNAND